MKIHLYENWGDKPDYVTEDEHRRTAICGYIRKMVTRNKEKVTCYFCLRKGLRYGSVTKSMKIMNRAQYQAHFIASYGARWESMSVEKRADEWDRCMEHRKEIEFLVWPNPWRCEK